MLMIANDLVGCRYVEPYAGGASVALSLLFEEFAESIHINDIDSGIFSLWKSILDHTEALCGRISKLGVTMEEWERQRLVQASDSASELDLAVLFFFKPHQPLGNHSWRSDRRERTGGRLEDRCPLQQGRPNTKN